MLHLIASFISLLSIISLTTSSPIRSQSQVPIALEAPRWCPCSFATKEQTPYLCGETILGNITVPKTAIVVHLLDGYTHLGGLSPCEFWNEYFNFTGHDQPEPKKRWNNPPNRGWVVGDDGKELKKKIVLTPGTLIDRFGGVNGSYLSPFGTPYAARALSPMNLYDENYRVYEVVNNITVLAGATRPYYGQPGMGIQFYLGPDEEAGETTKERRVFDLLESGDLKPFDISEYWQPSSD